MIAYGFKPWTRKMSTTQRNSSLGSRQMLGKRPPKTLVPILVGKLNGFNEVYLSYVLKMRCSAQEGRAKGPVHLKLQRLRIARCLKGSRDHSSKILTEGSEKESGYQAFLVKSLKFLSTYIVEKSTLPFRMPV